MIGDFRTLGDRHLLNIAHFPKTLAGQTKPVLFSNWNSLGDDLHTLGPFLLNGAMTGLTMDLFERVDNYFGEDNDPKTVARLHQSILPLLNVHQNLGAGGDQARPLARRLIEKHHALAEQKRIKKHGASVGIPR